MKPAFQSAEAFLGAVRQTFAAQAFGLWWLGQSGFLVVGGGRRVLFDPYLSDSLTRKYAGTDKPHARMTERVVEPAALGALGIDLVTCSHNHTDHLDAETLLPVLSASPQAKLAIPAANRDFVLDRLGGAMAPRLVELDEGKSAIIAGLELHGIAAAHQMTAWDSPSPSHQVERDSAGRCKCLGYVARWGGRSIYHSGDTLRHAGLAEALKPFAVEVALLPINGDRPERRVAGNLDGREAARLAFDIGTRLVVPCHYDMFDFNTTPPDEFVEECARLGQPCRVLRNGEGLSLV